MNHIREDNSFKSNSEGDGQPVQLYESGVIVQNVPFGEIRNVLLRNYQVGVF
jgi:hypothetical protein